MRTLHKGLCKSILGRTGIIFPVCSTREGDTDLGDGLGTYHFLYGTVTRQYAKSH